MNHYRKGSLDQHWEVLIPSAECFKCFKNTKYYNAGLTGLP